MKIHEYQAKELLKEYGAPVPDGTVCTTPEEVYNAAAAIGPCVLKAQIHSGARGKAGGVKFAKTAEEAKELAGRMFGMKLVTNQTGPQGRIVQKILVTDAVRERDRRCGARRAYDPGLLGRRNGDRRNREKPSGSSHSGTSIRNRRAEGI